MFSSGGQSFRASLIPDQRSIQIFGIFKKNSRTLRPIQTRKSFFFSEMKIEFVRKNSRFSVDN
jgi:hypothetical protein